jgi:hypothetical protein
MKNKGVGKVIPCFFFDESQGHPLSPLLLNIVSGRRMKLGTKWRRMHRKTLDMGF